MELPHSNATRTYLGADAYKRDPVTQFADAIFPGQARNKQSSTVSGIPVLLE